MKIYIVRHTKVDVAEKTIYGQTDVPLAASSENDIAAVLKKVKGKSAQIISSPLSRCKAISQKLSDNPIYDDRLKEINMGDWEMKSYKTVPKEKIHAWLNDIESISPPNGETYTQLSERVYECFLEMVESYSGDLIFVGHDGTIRSIFSKVMDISINKTKNLKINYGAVLLIEYKDKKFRVEELF